MRRVVKEISILVKNFIVNLIDPKINFYAASLSWSTLFFLVPFLVIVLSITINTPIFNDYYEKIYQFITSNLLPAKSILIIEWIDKFVDNASKMGNIGFIYISIAAILFFKDFDYIVNDIYSTKQRNFFSALLFYTFLLLLIPTTILVSIWLLILIGSEFYIINILLQFIIIWFIIFITYKFAPKSRTSIKPALISSFLATFIWTVAKAIFILYVEINKTYTTIYGAIAILLFLFLWIYISWVIFLYGLQLNSMLDSEF